MKCNNCGSEIPLRARVCPSCHASCSPMWIVHFLLILGIIFFSVLLILSILNCFGIGVYTTTVNGSVTISSLYFPGLSFTGKTHLDALKDIRLLSLVCSCSLSISIYLLASAINRRAKEQREHITEGAIFIVIFLFIAVFGIDYISKIFK